MGLAVVVVEGGAGGGDARRTGADGGFCGASDVVAGADAGAGPPPTNMENMSSNVSSGAATATRGGVSARVSLVGGVGDGTARTAGASTSDSRGTGAGSGVVANARARALDPHSRRASSKSASSVTRLTHAYADDISVLAPVADAPIVVVGRAAGTPTPSSSSSESDTTSNRLDLGRSSRGAGAFASASASSFLVVVFPFPRAVFTGGGRAAASTLPGRRRRLTLALALALAPASRVVATNEASISSPVRCRSLARVIRLDRDRYASTTRRPFAVHASPVVRARIPNARHASRASRDGASSRIHSQPPRRPASSRRPSSASSTDRDERCEASPRPRASPSRLARASPSRLARARPRSRARAPPR